MTAQQLKVCVGSLILVRLMAHTLWHQDDPTFIPKEHSGICSDMWIFQVTVQLLFEMSCRNLPMCNTDFHCSFQLLGSDSCPSACNQKVK